MPPGDPVLNPECEPEDDEGGETPVAEPEVVSEVPEKIIVPNVPEEIVVEDPARVAERAQHDVDIQFNRDTFPPVRSGYANDGLIYVNKKGMKVRLDVAGREFQCDLDGIRNTRKSARPEGMDPEMWKMLRPHREKAARQAAKALKL